MLMLSVIIPNYKAEEELFVKCINSIVQTSYQDYEVIVVDDGNTEEYRKNVYENSIFMNEKIKIIYQGNQGVSAARNRGMQEARGKYLTFVDADDYVIGDFIAESIQIGTEHNADMVIGCLISPQYYDQETKSQENLNVTCYGEKDRDVVKTLLIGKRYYIGNSRAYVGRGSVAKILKSEIAKKVDFDSSLKIYEDTTWNLDVIDLSKIICRVDKVWYGYNYVSSSASKGFHSDEIERSTIGMREIYKRLDLSIMDLRRAFCEQCLLEYSRIMKTFFLNKGNKASRIEKIKRSRKMINDNPWNIVREEHFEGLDKHMKLRVKLYKYNLWLPLKMLYRKNL